MSSATTAGMATGQECTMSSISSTSESRIIRSAQWHPAAMDLVGLHGVVAMTPSLITLGRR